MLDTKYLRENLEIAEARLKTRGGSADLSGFRALDEERRKLLQGNELLKAERNRVSDEIGKVKDKSLVQDQILEMRAVSNTIKEQDEELKQVEEALAGLLLTIPNIPSAATPVGASEVDNMVVRTWGEKPSFAFAPKAHWEPTTLCVADLRGYRHWVEAGKPLTAAATSS